MRLQRFDLLGTLLTKASDDSALLKKDERQRSVLHILASTAKDGLTAAVKAADKIKKWYNESDP